MVMDPRLAQFMEKDRPCLNFIMAIQYVDTKIARHGVESIMGF